MHPLRFLHRWFAGPTAPPPDVDEVASVLYERWRIALGTPTGAIRFAPPDVLALAVCSDRSDGTRSARLTLRVIDSEGSITQAVHRLVFREAALVDTLLGVLRTERVNTTEVDTTTSAFQRAFF